MLPFALCFPCYVGANMVCTQPGCSGKLRVLQTRERAGKIERRRRCDKCRRPEPTVELPKRIYVEMARVFLGAPKCKEVVLAPGTSARIIASAR